MTDSPRIDELRRRVEADPTSIAFAALAEEYRRAGRYEDAVEVCRNGLRRHPAYLSARVTLGRALIELYELDEARMELEQVLSIAPENLAAIRALAEIHGRRGEPAAQAPPARPAPLAPTQAAHDEAFELDLMPVAPLRAVEPPEPAKPPSLPPRSPEADAQAPVLAALHRLLDAVVEIRARR